MLDLQLPGVYYYENIEGGHGGAADNKQRAFMSTLMFSFLHQVLVEGSLAAKLAARPPQDGGRRTVANILHRAHAIRGLPKWVAPVLSLLAIATLAVRQRSRLH